jgi:hypothetical protein
MKEHLFILLLILIIIGFIYYTNKSQKEREKFEGLKLVNIESGTNSFDDKLFNDVVMYKSDTKDTAKAGIYECLEKCKGNCVEYGITGNAFCFPKN